MKKNVIVTGSNGFIGRNLVKQLTDAGYNVFGIDNYSTSYKPVKENGNKYFCDIRNQRDMLDAFSDIQKYGDVDAVFHLAALSVVSESDEKKDEYFDVNVTGTRNVILCCEETGINNILFASSAAVYEFGNVKNGYSTSKASAEYVISASNIKNKTILRLFNVIGEGENRKKETHLVPLIIENIFNETEMTIFDLDSQRDYIDVNDVSKAFLYFYEYPRQTINISDICSGRGTTNRAIIQACESITNRKLKYVTKQRRSFDPDVIIGDPLYGIITAQISITTSIQNAVDHYVKNSSSFKINNPKLAVGNTKVGFQSIPPSAFVYMAKAMNDGANKYGARNWRESEVIMSIYLDAMMRHLLCVMDGEDIAEDSRIEHLAHIMANCAIILDAQQMKVINDDRKATGNVSEVLHENTKDA